MTNRYIYKFTFTTALPFTLEERLIHGMLTNPTVLDYLEQLGVETTALPEITVDRYVVTHQELLSYDKVWDLFETQAQMVEPISVEQVYTLDNVNPELVIYHDFV